MAHLADAHWWPESYYLGTIQAREALYQVSDLTKGMFRYDTYVC